MRQKLVPLDIFVGGMDCDAMRALKAKGYSSEFLDLIDAEIINAQYSDYIYGLCDGLFSINTRASSKLIHSMHRHAVKLSEMLYQCDTLALAQDYEVDTPDGDCREIIEKWHRPEGLKQELDDQTRIAIARVNAELVRIYPRVNPELIGLGLALEQARDNYYGGTFGPLFIFNLRQLMGALSDFLEIEISALEAHERAQGDAGAIKDIVTETFLLFLWELYRSISKNEEMDDGYYSLVEILAEAADSEVSNNY